MEAKPTYPNEVRTMGFGDMKNKLNDMISKNSDKVDEGIGKAANFADEKTGGKHSDKIDSAADRARDYVDKSSDEDQGPSQDNR